MMEGPWFRCVGMAAVCFTAVTAYAHPEFQIFVQKNSSRNVDCAMCHAHPDGPEGPKPGQIGSLSPEEIGKLQEARAAFEPGQIVHNPLLNAFGNSLVERLGKRKILELRTDPGALAEAIGDTADLDGDGISDGDEYMAGTHPVDPQHGDPWRLFVFNLQRNAFHLVMIALATACGLYGLNNLLRWFDLRQRVHDASSDAITTER